MKGGDRLILATGSGLVAAQLFGLFVPPIHEIETGQQPELERLRKGYIVPVGASLILGAGVARASRDLMPLAAAAIACVALVALYEIAIQNGTHLPVGGHN